MEVASENDTPAPSTKDQFGKYKIVSLMKEGFSGNLYKAIDTETGDTVLLRIVHPIISKHPLFRRALYDQQTANDYLMDHPNVLGLSETGKIKGRHYFATEFVDGVSLEDRLATGPLKLEEACAVLVQIAEGLRAAHRRKIVHGDLKPSDIFLCQDRHGHLNVKVAFFDLATAASESGVSIFGELVGTPKYLAPEQIAGRPPDVRSDIYALGVIAYRMFTGKDPFEVSSALGYLSANAYQEPLPPRKLNPAISTSLEAVLLRMLAKQPAARYQSCQNLIDDVERGQHHAATDRTALVPAGTDSAFALRAATAPPSRINLKTIVVLATLLLVTCMLGMVGFLVWLVNTHRLGQALPQQTTQLTSPAKSTALAKADPAQELLARAKELADQEQYDQALILARRVVKDHPESPLVGQAKEQISELTVLYDRAVAKRQAEQTAADFAKAQQAAKASLDVHDYDAAAAQYADFVKRHPDAKQTLEAKRTIEQVHWQAAKYDLIEKKHFAEALAQLKRVASQTVDKQLADDAKALIPDAMFQWAQSQLADPAQFDAAIDKFDEVRKNNPDTRWERKAAEAAAKALFEHSEALLKLKDYPAALAALRKVTTDYHATEWATKAQDQIPKATLAYADALFQSQEFDKAYEIVAPLENELTRPKWIEMAEPFVAKLLYVWAKALDQQGLKPAAEEKRQILRNHYGRTEWAKRLQPANSTSPNDLTPIAKLVRPQTPRDMAAEAAAQKIFEEAQKLTASAFDEYVAKLQQLASSYPNTKAGEKAAQLLPSVLYGQGLHLIGTGKLQEGLQLFDRITAQYPKSDWAKKVAEDALAREQTPEGMVYVPGGTAVIGSTEQDIEKAAAEFYGSAAVDYAKTLLLQETPQVVKVVAPFYIDRTEVTNKQYHEFIKATQWLAPSHWLGGMYPAGEADLPVYRVSAKDAEAYAKWANKRLPTEAEWELAARGQDGRVYPWGDKFDPAKCNSREGGVKRPTKVGSYPAGASPYGCLDMAGNVSEWTQDLFLPYPGTKAQISKAEQSYRVHRGGSCIVDGLYVRTPCRFGAMASDARVTIGFRCVRSVQAGN